MICSRCNIDKPESSFNIAGRRKDGTPILRTYCTKCYVLAKKPRQLEFKEWFRELKRVLSCDSCGLSFQDEPYLCDFHHTDPSTKSFELGDAVSSAKCSKLKILKEVAKCIPLCPTCHRRHHNRSM